MSISSVIKAHILSCMEVLLNICEDTYIWQTSVSSCLAQVLPRAGSQWQAVKNSYLGKHTHTLCLLGKSGFSLGWKKQEVKAIDTSFIHYH